jgi:hypothetical protein
MALNSQCDKTEKIDELESISSFNDINQGFESRVKPVQNLSWF